MIRKTLLTLALSLSMITLCFAADITGHWKGTINDQFEISYDFKVDGEKLTGATKTMEGAENPIKDGVIKGDDLSFTIDIMGTATKVTGKVVGEIITLSFSYQEYNIKVDLKKDKV
jgi:hypothetical protein